MKELNQNSEAWPTSSSAQISPPEEVSPVCYEIYGYLEYIAVIPVGSSSVRVHFTGGSISGYGTCPATMTTRNPVLQHIIEHSQLYKTGRIRKKE